VRTIGNDFVKVSEEHRIVQTIYVLAFLTMALMTTVTPTVLLFLNDVGFTSSADVHFYIVVSVIGSIVPVLSNVGLAHLSDLVGPGHALSLSCVLVGAGLLCMAVVRSSKLMFALAYTAYSLGQSLRIIRTLVIAHVVPESKRTHSMSMHALSTPLGALVGPVIWLVIERFAGRHAFSVAYVSAAFIAFLMAPISYIMFHALDLSTPHLKASNSADHDGHGLGGIDQDDPVVHVVMEDGHVVSLEELD
jgi:MFS family permease